MTRAPNPVLWPEHLLDFLTETEKQRLRGARKDRALSGLDTIELLHTIACLRTDFVNANEAHRAEMQRINGAMLLQRHDELDARFKADYDAATTNAPDTNNNEDFVDRNGVVADFMAAAKEAEAERECPMGHSGWRDYCVFCTAQAAADAIIPPQRK